MYKQGDGYFWIGGPGEEAFNVPLGLLINKGRGLQYDYSHFHYRNSATMLAMGAEPIDSLRQMKNTATDPYSGGRNFSNHYSKREWNVVPVSSVIEPQYSICIGTGIAQKRAGGRGITIVTGGDAGTAEGDLHKTAVRFNRVRPTVIAGDVPPGVAQQVPRRGQPVRQGAHPAPHLRATLPGDARVGQQAELRLVLIPLSIFEELVV